MTLIFQQSDFSGGLITQFDPTKTPRNTYPLAVDVETRRNIVEPRRRPVKQSSPDGYKGGLYSIGSQLVMFVDGLAYIRDISLSDTFQPVSGFDQVLETSRVYAELVPVTFNLFNRTATSVESITRAFNSSIAPFPQCLVVGDGNAREQAIFADGTARVIGEYSNWTQDEPSYVPAGTVRCFCGDKLYVSSPDGTKVLNSVTGRPTDFVVNVDNSGDKAGDAYTFYTAPSGNPLTALKAGDNGSVIATTQYATFLIVPDFTITFWGEPFLRTQVLFPVGAVNDLSFVNLNGDVAFISSTGIHTFNQTSQNRIESNNKPLGAKIYGLLDNPQTDTCAVDFDDDAFFAVNTIHGRGVLRYNNALQQFISLELAFGQVRQFAVAYDASGPRLFYIAADDELYEAYASDSTLAGRIYIGDFANPSGIESRVDSVVLTFTNIMAGGSVRCGLWVDGERTGEQTQVLTAETPAASSASIPREDRPNTKSVQFNYSQANEGTKIGLMIEWDFDAALSFVSLFGEAGPEPQVGTTLATDTERTLWFLGGNRPAMTATTGTCVDVVKDDEYVYAPGAADEEAIIGKLHLTKLGPFTAPGTSLACNPGTTFALRNYTALSELLSTCVTADAVYVLGNFFDLDGTVDEELEWTSAAEAMRVAARYAPVTYISGPTEGDNNSFFYGHAEHPRVWSESPISGVRVFSYDPGLDSAAAVLASPGIATGPTTNPNGWLSTSDQALNLEVAIENATEQYKIIVCPLPAYDESLSGGGYTQLRHIGAGATMVISGAVGEYTRVEYGGATWVNVPTGYVLKMNASNLGLRCDVYYGAVHHDTFTVVKPS